MGWHGLIREWLSFLQLPPQRVAPRLAFALSLVVFGFGLGWTLRPRAERVVPSEPGNVTSSSLAEADLENMRINDISRVAPDPKTGDVRITMDAQRRVTLEGSLDDPRIQQLLVYAVKSYDNAGIRRDTLDALRARTKSPNVRAALLYTMQHDPNVGNRLAALDAVRGMQGGDDLQQTLIRSSSMTGTWESGSSLSTCWLTKWRGKAVMKRLWAPWRVLPQAIRIAMCD